MRFCLGELLSHPVLFLFKYACTSTITAKAGALEMVRAGQARTATERHGYLTAWRACALGLT